MGKWTRRNILVAGSALVGFIGGRASKTASETSGPEFPNPPSYRKNTIILNDASTFSPTMVARHIIVDRNPDEAFLASLRSVLAQAHKAQQPVIASAARHSMGGHSLIANATALTFQQTFLETDAYQKTYRVAAGARWSSVITRLDAEGFSPKVMQSNNDFGVASSFSVNAHGWPVPQGGCGHTVRSIKVLLADGSLLSCSRTENPELFQCCMGGYGLLGIITELEIEMVPNQVLAPAFEYIRGEEAGLYFADLLAKDRTIEMAYGRMDISLDHFMEDAILVTYRPSPDQSQIPSAKGSGLVSHASREIFRSQLSSNTFKHLRWWAEKEVGPIISGITTRNSLLNEPVITLENTDPGRVDILQEYFISPAQFAAFVKLCREIIPASYQQLLNVTLRFVDTDRESVLAYAPDPRLCLVMLFSQEKTVRSELDMKRMTQALIESVIALGGSYYLPYRPHATRQQFEAAYANAKKFAALKRHYDPKSIFQNQFWERYLS